MNTLKIKTRNEAEENFYAKRFYFSYSGLNKLLYSPGTFYSWYILNEKEESLDAHLVGGKIIHCLILEPENFHKQFVILPGKLPGSSNKKILENIYKENSDKSLSSNLDDYKSEILQELKYMQLHQKLVDDKDLSKVGAKKGDEKRLSKIITDENKEYFKFLVNSNGKIVIDQDLYNKCEKSVEAITNDNHISDLLKLRNVKDDFELSNNNVDVLNELPIKAELKTLPFGFKGIIDNLVLDHSNQRVIINDLKTTSKSLVNFPETVEYYKYWMQAAMYYRLTQQYIGNKAKNAKDYKIEFNFIVIDKLNQVYAFPVKDKTMDQWLIDLDGVVKQAMWHYTKNNYNLPYEFALKQVTL